MVKSKKVEGVQIRARGPCPILCDVHTPESPSQRPMGTVIRGFRPSGMNQPVPARIQGVSGSGIPGHLDPPMQGARRIPESSAEGNGDSMSLPASPCPRPWKKRSPRPWWRRGKERTRVARVRGIRVARIRTNPGCGDSKKRTDAGTRNPLPAGRPRGALRPS